MAVIAKQRYKLDIAPKGGWVIVYASQHDNEAREIEFEITNQGKVFDIPANINVSVQGVKSNSGYFTHSCSYSGNVVTMALADDMTDVTGKAVCVLKFTNSSQQKLATAKFILNIDSDSSSEGIIIDTEAEEIFNQMLNEIRAQASAISADIAELQSMVGAPLVASTASAMTNHNKIYVYTGSESGYTNGNWYYWNGSAWTSGGVYNAVAFETDKTLSVEDMAADAKVTGDRINSLNSDLNGAMQDLSIITDGDYAQYTPVTMDGWAYVNTVGRIDRHDTKVARTYLLDVSDQPEEVRINVSSDANRARFLYMETPIESVGIGTLGTYVDGGLDRVFTLTKANYGSYKTIAINTDYNKTVGDVLGTVSAIKVSKKLIEKVDAALERVEVISEGGTNVYQAVQMEGWAYVNDIGRINIHPTSGARTYLIDVSEQPESVHIKISNNANRARFLYMETRIDYVENGTTGIYIDGGSVREFTLTKNDYVGYNTIAINTDYNRGSSSSATYATIEVEKTAMLTAVDHTAREALEEIGNTGKKGCGLFETAATLTNNSLILCSHIDNKKNASVEFWGEIGSGFSSVRIGHGYNVSYSGYVEIDSTNVKWYESNGSLQKTEPHGLTFDGFVHVLIEQDDNAKATVKVATAGGEYVMNGCTFHGSRGDVFCTVTGVMTNVSLSACFRDLLDDIWYFGDSYISMADRARWPYYAVQSGHCDFYLNGFGGANSSHALPSLNEALAISTPRIIVWGIGMNNSDSDSAINSSYASILNDIMQICEEREIELILCTIPNTPTRRHTFKNDFVRASGYRYIDFAKAVGADAAESTWYDGMLEASNSEAEEQLRERVHPTVLGAKALYYRLITDVPEMNK